MVDFITVYGFILVRNNVDECSRLLFATCFYLEIKKRMLSKSEAENFFKNILHIHGKWSFLVYIFQGWGAWHLWPPLDPLVVMKCSLLYQRSVMPNGSTRRIPTCFRECHTYLKVV